MGRRRKDEGLIELVAMFPWWVGVVLAVLSWLLMSALAAQPISPGSPLSALIRGGATGLRIILPIVFLVGAVASAFARFERTQLLKNAAGARGEQAVERMSWADFEKLLSEAFRHLGYRVAETGGGGADGGIDLVLRRGDEVTLVQCKHWKAYKVGVTVVRELVGVMTAKRAARGMVVTSGRFTEEAATFARSVSVQLIDGPKLRDLLAKAGATERRAQEMEDLGLRAEPAVRSDVGEPPPGRLTPVCPTCAAPMVRRTASKGTRAGQDFWGCSTYPRCRGTRAL